MPRQLTQGERDELISYMQGMTANEAFVNQRVKNVQDEGTSPMYGYLDPGDKIFTNPAAIYRTIPSIEENFESLPLDLQQQIIRGGRARDEASFMGAPSNSGLVTPNQSRFGLLSGDMPYNATLDPTTRQQLSPEQEAAAMEAVQGTERVLPDLPENPFLRSAPQTPAMPSAMQNQNAQRATPGVLGTFAPQTYTSGAQQMRDAVTSPAPQRPGVSMIDAGQMQGQPQSQTPKSVFGGNLADQLGQIMKPVADRVAQKRGFTSQSQMPSVDQSRGASAGGLLQNQQQGAVTNAQMNQLLNQQANLNAQAEQAQQLRQVTNNLDSSVGGEEVLGVNDNGRVVDEQTGAALTDVEGNTDDAKAFADKVARSEEKNPGFFQRALRDPIFWANAAIAFNTLRTKPDASLTAAMTQRIKDIRQVQTSSRTADWLAKNNYPTLSAAVANQSLSGSDAMKLALARGSKQLVTAEKYKELFGTEIPEKYKGSILIYDANTGDLSQVGGGGITIDQRAETKEAELKAVSFAKRMENYQEAGANATSALLTIQQLENLNETGNIDAVPAWMRATLPQWVQNDDTQMYIALMNGLAQTQRVTGTGSQSDRDVELLIQKVGSIGANRLARQYALNALKKQTRLNQQRADIAGQWAIGSLTKEEAFAKLRELEKLSLFSDEERGYISNLETKGAPGGPSGDKNDGENIFAGVPKDIVDEIKASQETFDLFKKATPEDRKRFIEALLKDRKNSTVNENPTVFEGDVGA